MLKKIIKKGRDFLINHDQYQRQIDDIKIQNGLLFSIILHNNLKNIKNLFEVNFKVFSQNNEDGIIDYLIKSLKIQNIKFIEIGTENYSESNTRYLYETSICRGLLIDDFCGLENEIKKRLKIWKGELKIYNHLINSKNILNVLEFYEFDKNVDIFSIDIDGIDYWIIKELPPKISKIFICEYNPYFGPDLEITVPNIDNFNRTKYHYSNLCWGASLKSIIKILEKKGYTFIGTNNLKNNAFFILTELTSQLSIDLPNINKLSTFTKAYFKESRNIDGKLSFIDTSKILDTIKDCEIVDLSNQKEEKIKLKEII